MELGCRTSSRGSGTATRPTFGSMVQKGKLAACALAFSESALNRVDCKIGNAAINT